MIVYYLRGVLKRAFKQVINVGLMIYILVLDSYTSLYDPPLYRYFSVRY